MPTKREREYYSMGFADGKKFESGDIRAFEEYRDPKHAAQYIGQPERRKPKRKLSAWNKFVKANSRKKEFRYANGKLKLKKMGIAFRKKKRR